MSDNKEQLITAVRDKIKNGLETIEKLKGIGKVEGINKLERKIRQEVRFLEKVRIVPSDYHLIDVMFLLFLLIDSM